ncbi:MAG: hypothetical protein QOE45_3285 [Frankiaceae bacterium]|jgi:hypothetical protein|nr:hypothetical protein [Frankiaceae bacterium]
MKKLTLKKEILGSLDPAELRAVVGGVPTGTANGIPTVDACPLTGIWPTLPVRGCLGLTGTG